RPRRRAAADRRDPRAAHVRGGAMRILYQLTSPMDRTVLGPAEVTRRREFLRQRAAPGADVEVWSLADGPASIESAYEAALVVPELTRAVVRAGGGRRARDRGLLL